MERREYWYWLCTIPGTGSVTINRLLEQFGDVETLFHIDEKYLTEKLFSSNLSLIHIYPGYGIQSNLYERSAHAENKQGAYCC